MNYLDEAVTKSLDEFMEYYKVVDIEEIYSNGTEFVPIFRVKQWEEYNNKDKEIERLNNIINELEKYLIEEIEDYDKNINSQYITDIAREQYEGEKVCFEDTLGKLQELKGDKSNGSI